jgi:hypothetical protein
MVEMNFTTKMYHFRQILNTDAGVVCSIHRHTRHFQDAVE